MPRSGSPTALNFERIVQAKADHNGHCDFPPHTVVLNPFDVERLGWAVGDKIAGLAVAVDERVQADRFRLVCDKPQPTPGGATTSTAVHKREPVAA